jgi:hypothetical protein
MRQRLLVVLLLALCALLASCTTQLRNANDIPNEATTKSFANNYNAKGIVLLDVNWDRRWKCGGFENAELKSIAFDRLSLVKSSDDALADLTITEFQNSASRPAFKSYAFILEPDDYALSNFSIKAARSMSDIVYLGAKRSDLLKDGKALGGTFKVGAGETVYIGNFFLDCFQHPQLWRYYTEGTKNFKFHLTQYKQKYPFIDVDHVVYRLFETDIFGLPYELK